MISAFRSLTILSPGRLELYRGAAALVVLRIIQLGAGLAATYFLARSMNRDAFGEYNMVLNAIGVLSVFSLGGLNNSLVQAVARGYVGTYRAIVPIAFGSSFLGSALLVGLSGWYSWQEQLQLAQGLLISASLFPFAHGLLQWKSLVAGKAKFSRLLFHDGTASVATCALVVGAVVLYPGEYVLPIIVGLLVPGIYNVALTLVGYGQIAPNAPVERHNIRYGIETTLFSTLGAIGSNLDRLLLFFLLSPAALAVFVAAGRIPEIFSGAIQDISAVLAPRLAMYESYNKRLDRIFAWLSLIYGGAIVLVAFTAMPYLVVFLFGEAYADAIPYAQALTCSAAVGSLASLRFRYIRSRIDARSFRDITVTSSVVRLVAFLILVPPFGLAGAVIGTFIYRFALIGVVHFAIKRHYAPAI